MSMIARFRSSVVSRVPSKHHETAGQFLRYGLIGLLNVAVSLSVFNLLGRSVPDYIVAFVVSNTLSFFLNKRWAFKDLEREAVGRQYMLFVFFTAIGAVLLTGTFSLLLIPLKRFGAFGRNAAFLGSIPVAVIWNFTAYRRWTFKAAGSRGSSAA